MRIVLLFYRILLIALFLSFFAWLAIQNTVVSGHFFVQKDFCTDSRFISDLYPDNRVGRVEQIDSGKCFQRVFVEPVYFKVKIPRTFANAKVKLIFANPDQPFLQLGVMKKKLNPLDWRFTLKLIENKIFDNLDWFKLTEKGVSFWQKQKSFESIYDYVNNVPTDQKTVTFYYEFSKEAVKNPTKVVAWNSETLLEHVDYIISKYTSPKIINNQWQEQIAEFLVGPDYMNDHYLEFIISAPGLTENRYEIKIMAIDIELSRPATDWPIFLTDLKNYFIRKISKLIW